MWSLSTNHRPALVTGPREWVKKCVPGSWMKGESCTHHDPCVHLCIYGDTTTVRLWRTNPFDPSHTREILFPSKYVFSDKIFVSLPDLLSPLLWIFLSDQIWGSAAGLGGGSSRQNNACSVCAGTVTWKLYEEKDTKTNVTQTSVTSLHII